LLAHGGRAGDRERPRGTGGPTEMEEAACAERCAARVPSGFPEPQQPGSAPRST